MADQEPPRREERTPPSQELPPLLSPLPDWFLKQVEQDKADLEEMQRQEDAMGFTREKSPTPELTPQEVADNLLFGITSPMRKPSATVRNRRKSVKVLRPSEANITHATKAVDSSHDNNTGHSAPSEHITLPHTRSTQGDGEVIQPQSPMPTSTFLEFTAKASQHAKEAVLEEDQLRLQEMHLENQLHTLQEETYQARERYEDWLDRQEAARSKLLQLTAVKEDLVQRMARIESDIAKQANLEVAAIQGAAEALELEGGIASKLIAACTLHQSIRDKLARKKEELESLKDL